MKTNKEKQQLNLNVEIPVYDPNQGITPREYRVSEKLLQFEEGLKKQCIDFLSKSSPDQYNSSYMDAVIERLSISEIKLVKVQRCDHTYSIVKLLDNMHKGDYIKYKNKLENLKRDKEINQLKLNKYKRIYHYGTSLQETQE